MKRIWLDTLVLNEAYNITDLQRLIDAGHTLVIANTALDVQIFQENLLWFENEVKEGHIIIEIWNTPDEMVAKEFYWCSIRKTTQPAETLEEAVAGLDKACEICELARIVNLYGKAKGEWPQGKWAPPEKLDPNDAEVLGIPADTDNRTTVLAAAKAKQRRDIFDRYNLGYCRGLAKQHTCDAIISYSIDLFTDI